MLTDGGWDGLTGGSRGGRDGGGRERIRIQRRIEECIVRRVHSCHHAVSGVAAIVGGGR